MATGDTGVLGVHHTVLVVDETHANLLSPAGLTGATTLSHNAEGPTDKAGAEDCITIVGEHKDTPSPLCLSIDHEEKYAEKASVNIYKYPTNVAKEGCGVCSKNLEENKSPLGPPRIGE